MSSILDALDRAAKERSDLVAPPAADRAIVTSIPRRRGVWFMLGVALVLATLIGYGLLPKPQTKDPLSPPPARVNASVADETPSAPGVPHRSGPVPSVTEVPDLQSRLRDTGPPSRRSLLTNARVSPATEPLRIKDPEPVQASQDVVEAQPMTAVAPRDATDTSSVSAHAPASESVLEPPAAPLSREVVGVPVPAAAEKIPPIPLVWELPQAEREALLELSISIHVYHEDPQRRFVIINMHRYVEGDRLKEKGYRLERIDQDGIVLDYGAGLVRIPRS